MGLPALKNKLILLHVRHAPPPQSSANHLGRCGLWSLQRYDARCAESFPPSFSLSRCHFSLVSISSLLAACRPVCAACRHGACCSSRPLCWRLTGFPGRFTQTRRSCGRAAVNECVPARCVFVCWELRRRRFMSRAVCEQ